ncbi:hypothetical protein SKAU_G00160140 [Synaphobranchus kaupii]|uniref:Uncharacterized protein n=1 Tax=Synaphobranchus kaupii TaxID=118154 RepID=A0A9Q1IXK2_SYNKA|nr:hypothetical protein SKAU_G00160140 [Synaphobranchus kaupii]
MTQRKRGAEEKWGFSTKESCTPLSCPINNRGVLRQTGETLGAWRDGGRKTSCTPLCLGSYAYAERSNQRLGDTAPGPAALRYGAEDAALFSSSETHGYEHGGQNSDTMLRGVLQPTSGVFNLKVLEGLATSAIGFHELGRGLATGHVTCERTEHEGP